MLQPEIQIRQLPIPASISRNSAGQKLCNAPGLQRHVESLESKADPFSMRLDKRLFASPGPKKRLFALTGGE